MAVARRSVFTVRSPTSASRLSSPNSKVTMGMSVAGMHQVVTLGGAWTAERSVRRSRQDEPA